VQAKGYQDTELNSMNLLRLTMKQVTGLKALSLTALLLAIAQVNPANGQSVPGASSDTEYREAIFSAGPPISADCTTKGYDCIVSGRFVVSDKLTSTHDQSLQEASSRINRILDELRVVGQKIGKKPCLYRSKYGLLLIWVEDKKTESSSKSSRQGIIDPDRVAVLLQIEPGIAGASPKQEKLLEFVWYDKVGYFWRCTNAGAGCTVASLARASATTVHDEALIMATEKINSLFAEYAQRAPAHLTKMCILMVPAGPVLGWVSTDPSLKSTRVISVGPQSKEYESLINESLGIVRQPNR
jgi:hypothetical protein